MVFNPSALLCDMIFLYITPTAFNCFYKWLRCSMNNFVSLNFLFSVFFFFNDTATTEIYTLSLHDALPICPLWLPVPVPVPVDLQI